MATLFSILAWKIPWTGYSLQGHKELDTTEQLSTSSTNTFPEEYTNSIVFKYFLFPSTTQLSFNNSYNMCIWSFEVVPQFFEFLVSLWVQTMNSLRVSQFFPPHLRTNGYT